MYISISVYTFLKGNHVFESQTLSFFTLFRYSFMSDCWRDNPDDRPTFEQLISTLEEMMTRDTPYFDPNKITTIDS